jgi:Prealbumin-like fold domain
VLSRVVYKKQRGRRLLTALATVGLLAGTLATASAVLAVHNTGVFQMDGNAQTIVQSTPPALEDWDLICKAHPADCSFAAGVTPPAGTTTATSSSFTTDGVNASIFTGGGSKDPQDLPNWSWKDGSVPDKDNLLHAFAARYSTTPSTTCPVTGAATTCDLLYFGSDRFDNSGDAQQGFWFFQHKVVANGANGTFVDAAGAPATHTNGDILIVSDFSNGGTTSIVNVYRWFNGGLTFVAGGPNQLCAPSLGTDPFCGIVNPTNGTIAPWLFTDKSGNHTYLQGEFYEAGINLSDPSINLANECFSSFLSETRSSTSTTATLKDFVLGQLAPCGAGIQINPPTATNEVGATHIFTVHVTKTVGGATVPAAGVFPTVTLAATNGAVISNIVNNCALTGTDASGNCTVTFTSNSAGVVTGHAAADVGISGSTFHVETDGTGTNSGNAVKTFVDAKIAVSPLTATNEVNSAHTITATVQQNDGLATGGDGVNGFAPAPAGTLVTFSLLNNSATATFVGGNTCTTIGVTGACTVQINTSSAGSVDIHATTTFNVGGISVTRATTGTGGNSVNANKVYVDAYITIGPATATNTVGDPHTFTVTVKQNLGDGAGFVNAPDGTKPTVTLTDTLGASSSISSNTCASPGTVNGTCTVTFTSTTAGTVTGHATVTLTVGGVSLTRATDGTGQNSGDAVKFFVAGSISWQKVDNALVLQGGATFNVCKTQSYTLPGGPLVDITPVCFDVVDDTDGTIGPGIDQDPAAGKFLLNSLSLGTYTITETVAPAGFLVDPTVATVSLIPGQTVKSVTNPFVNRRPVLKISGFGYTNVATGTPTSGVLSGTTVFTFTLHNYGNGAALLTGSSLVVSANASCTGGNSLPITGTIAAGGNYTGTNTLTCIYTSLTDGDAVTATLTVKTLTNTITREASGSPAVITFHVQGD